MTTNLFGIQFIEENGRNNNIAIISSNWLTPKKQQTFWPPYKKQHQYEQSLKKDEIPTDKWTLYNITKVLFVEKAKKLLQFCEENSDVPSDFDTALERLNTINTSRTRKPPNRYCDSESSDNEGNGELLIRLKKKSHKNHLSRPPTISDDEFETRTINLAVTNTPQIVEKSASISNNTSSILTATNCIASTSSQKPQSTNLTGELSFQKQLLILLVEIKEQNTQILALLKKRN
ncbi:hypothetical protein ACS0PU_012461 [Formica fusca]